MRCKVGYWRTGLSVQFDAEATEEMRNAGVGNGLLAQVLVDRRLSFTKAMRGGSPLRKLTHGERANKPAGFDSFADALIGDRLFFAAGPGFKLPLFELHELEVDYDYSRDAFVTERLADDHLLPWPKFKCSRERLSADELREQCYLRIKSHMSIGGHGYCDEVGVPRETVRIMAGGYKMALDQARAELDARKVA